DRNGQLEPSYIEQVCANFKIDRSRPVITQLSSFDRASGQLEVIEAYKLARRYIDCQMVFAGVLNREDAESQEVLTELLRSTADDPDVKVLQLTSRAPLELNALERASTLIVHTPTREAFGVGVAEALWKAKPVIASAVGSISNQVIHKFTGALVHSVEG